MTENSNIRRIDELGRIVIPKDIRKKLHIKDSEPLEIFIDDGEIRIKKYSSLPDVLEYLEFLIDTASRITKNKYIVTNREKIIVSNELKYKDAKLEKRLEDMVLNCTEIKDELLEYTINEEKLKAYINAIPIIVDADRIGLLIEYNGSSGQNDYNMTKFLKTLIEKQLNNY